MSADGKFEKGPNHFMVLDAMSRDINSVEKIATGTKLNNEEVQLILNDLLTQRLIVKIQKKGFIFGKKKVEMGITAIGMKLLNTKKQELEEQKQQMQQSYESGDNNQLQGYMDANRMWMPMMLFSGIMDMMFFTSMMSFMGTAMNPMESAMMGDGGGLHQDISSSNNSDVDTNSNDNGTSGDSDNSTNNDTSDYDDSNTFDSSGFDSFDSGSGGYDSF
jgi:hypothetical protein